MPSLAAEEIVKEAEIKEQNHGMFCLFEQKFKCGMLLRMEMEPQPEPLELEPANFGRTPKHLYYKPPTLR